VFAPCGRPAPITCATLAVPLDRHDPSAGEVQLALESVPASGASSGTIVAIAGGPGDSGTALTTRFETWLAPALETHDLVVVDLRGTGRSDFLDCPQLDESCATTPGIHDYTTRDSADDLEAVRAALGVDKLALYGVSYGTKVAEAYAKRYPDHVEMLVLDSVVPLDGWDFYERPSYAAVAPMLGDVCAKQRCAGATSDPVADLRALVERADAGLSVRAIAADGSAARPTVVDAHDLYDLVVGAASADPVIRALLPGALRAAVAGDTAPLARLVVGAQALQGRRGGGTAFSPTVFRATTCEELPPGWWRKLTPGQRMVRLHSELARIGDAAFAPFDADVAAAGTPQTCLRWKVASTAPAIDGDGPPDVPVLVLSGVDDAVTPPSDAEEVAAQYPHAVDLEVPDTGHGVLAATPALSAGSTCAQRALRTFLSGGDVAQCADVAPAVPREPPPPRTLAAVKPWPGVKGDAGRIVRAVVATLHDVRVTASSLLLPRRGLRGGTFVRGQDSLGLSRIVLVPGVRVSGTYWPASGQASLRLALNKAAAQIQIRGGVLTGSVAGHAVRVLVGRA
jgi:pimeloyl-ACP methyl ester carboxylesterase